MEDLERVKAIEAFTQLANTDQDKYKKVMANGRKTNGVMVAKHDDSMVKLFYHAQKTLDLLDDVFGKDYLKHEMKRTGNLFLKSLEKFNNEMYQCSEKDQKTTMMLEEEQRKIFDLVTQTHNIYYPNLFEILTEYNKAKNRDAIIKQILDSQYAMFKDFEIPDIVVKQVLRIEPNALNMNILHLSEVVTRKKMMNLPRLNERTIDVITKMMNNAQINW